MFENEPVSSIRRYMEQARFAQQLINLGQELETERMVSRAIFMIDWSFSNVEGKIKWRKYKFTQEAGEATL